MPLYSDKKNRPSKPVGENGIVQHILRCSVCKANGRNYCDEGKQLIFERGVRLAQWKRACTEYYRIQDIIHALDDR